MQFQAVVSPVPQGWMDLNCRFLFSSLGLSMFFLFIFPPLIQDIKVPLRLSLVSLSAVCVLHTDHMSHNPEYIQTSGKGWLGASWCSQASSCTHLWPFLWELTGNGLQYWVTSFLAVLVVSHSSVAAENKKSCLSSDTHVTDHHIIFVFPNESFQW